MFLETSKFETVDDLIVIDNENIDKARKYRMSVLAGHNFIPYSEVKMDKKEFKAFTIPVTDVEAEVTRTYMPVDNRYLFANLLETGDKLGYGVSKIDLQSNSKNGKHFGVVRFKTGDEEVGPGMAFRNSYNKAFSIAIACGVNVHRCSNLAFSEVKETKKHAISVHESLQDIFRNMHTYMEAKYVQEKQFLDKLKPVTIQDSDIYTIVGQVAVKKVFTPTQVNLFVREIENQELFNSVTAHGLYMHATHSCKLAPAGEIMQNHVEVRNLFKNYFSIQ